MRRTRVLSALVLASVAACASDPVPVTVTPASGFPPRAERIGDTFYINLPVDTEPFTSEVPGTPDRIFPLVAEVYEELGIPIQTFHAEAYILGNARFTARRRVGPIALERIVDCGLGITGVNAASRPVTLHVVTQLKPLDSGLVRVETTVYGVSRPADGTSTNSTACSSRNGLEEYIANGIRKRAEG